MFGAKEIKTIVKEIKILLQVTVQKQTSFERYTSNDISYQTNNKYDVMNMIN